MPVLASAVLGSLEHWTLTGQEHTDWAGADSLTPPCLHVACWQGTGVRTAEEVAEAGMAPSLWADDGGDDVPEPVSHYEAAMGLDMLGDPATGDAAAQSFSLGEPGPSPTHAPGPAGPQSASLVQPAAAGPGGAEVASLAHQFDQLAVGPHTDLTMHPGWFRLQ